MDEKLGGDSSISIEDLASYQGKSVLCIRNILSLFIYVCAPSIEFSIGHVPMETRKRKRRTDSQTYCGSVLLGLVVGGSLNLEQ